MNYLDALIANGTKREHAAVLVQLDELARFDNLRHPRYWGQETTKPENDSEWCAFVAQTCGESL